MFQSIRGQSGPEYFLEEQSSREDIMKIRLVVTPEVYARLCGALSNDRGPLAVKATEIHPEWPREENDYWGGPKKNFVTLIRANSTNPGLIQIDLDVATGLSFGDIDSEHGSGWGEVGREKMDKLFDLLGIFPRSEKG